MKFGFVGEGGGCCASSGLKIMAYAGETCSSGCGELWWKRVQQRDLGVGVSKGVANVAWRMKDGSGIIFSYHSYHHSYLL